MKPRIAHGVQSLPSSGIRRFFDLVATLDDVISLGVGEPDFVTPWRIREAAIYSLEHGFTQYTSNAGLPALRTAIARMLAQTYGVEYHPESEVLVTVGVSEALDLALRAILNPGDEVLIPEPCYVSYRPCTTLAGGIPVGVPTLAEESFRVRAERLAAAITPRTRALMLNYPNNPTGASLRRANLQAIADLAEQHDLIVLSDEIYADLSYAAPHICLASLPGMRDRTLLLNGFSKAYAMTGWRVGYACGPADLIGAMTKIHQYTMLCASMPSQQAALEALRNGQGDRDEMVAQYSERRRLFVRYLNEIGLPCHEPDGAFYAFPSIGSTGLSSEAFAEQLLREERVAVVPGNAFGAVGEGYVRCSYAASLADLLEAVARMERFVRRHAASPARTAVTATSQ
ncbi:MAG: aminotransferase class I/II-fold pyridoxal phosphate-dependent enzyme [Armatimonadetes bacterium]|nr:aminotransferase class I/II-fold pyridoxal phosphate-dependent enzyme [Armatimonadota bacterium]